MPNFLQNLGLSHQLKFIYSPYSFKQYRIYFWLTMSHLAGSKRPASPSFASPSKPASKRSRIKYDYGDDDDTEPSPEDQWGPEDIYSITSDSEDDDSRDVMPSPSDDFMSTSSVASDEIMGAGGRFSADRHVTEVRHPRGTFATQNMLVF